MKAILRQVRITPKKAHLIAGMVRRKKVTDALDILKFTPKKAAKIMYKVIQSAASNAKNNFKQEFDHLYISEIYVTEGTTYKRTMPVSRGRAHPILKRTAHISVFLGVEVPKTESGKKKTTKTSEKKNATKKHADEEPKNEGATEIVGSEGDTANKQTQETPEEKNT